MSVSGACLEDEIALLSLAEKHYSPTNVVIAVDPWVFNGDNGVIAWVALADQYIDGIHAFSSASQSSDFSAETNKARSQYREQMKQKIFQLINAEYTWASWRSLPSHAGMYVAQDSDMAPVDSDLIRTDGSRVYSQKYARKELHEVEKLARQYAKPPVYLLDKFKRLNDWQKSRFELMLDHLLKHHKVLILMAPYHPITFGLIAPKYPAINEVEQYLRAVAKTKGIKVVGSYDPELAQCNESEFYDAMHPKASCMAKIMASRENN